MRRWVLLLLSIPVVLAFWAPRPALLPGDGSGFPVYDSLVQPSFIAKHIAYEGRYTFLNYSENFFEWQSYSAVLPIFNALKSTSYHKVKVVHIGDSHIQADMCTGQTRNRLQDVFGNGGRGMIFPYSAARTHSAYDYHTYHGGIWRFARNVHANPEFDLGLSGATIHTSDSQAWFKILFNSFHRPVENTVLKIFCKQGVQSYDLRVMVNGVAMPNVVSCRDSLMSYVLVTLPENPRSLSIYVKKTRDEQRYFECHGISLETAEDKGILYHSVGINGAGLNSLLRQKLMEQQLREIRPDLVIVDVGANDYYVGGLNESSYRLNLEEVVSRLRRSCPNATVLLTCSQDIYRYGRRSLKECLEAAALTREVANNNRCGFYDYYRASGNRYSMKKWRQYQLAKSDLVHLTYDGYKQKGDLYANALLGSYRLTLTKDASDRSFMVDSVESIRLARYTIRNPEKAQPVRLDERPASARPALAAAPAAKAGKRMLYTIESGDNLGKIAESHGVSVSEIKEWNALNSTMIRAGDRLIVYSQTESDTEKFISGGTVSAPAPAAPVKKGGVHVVKSGESLWRIARSYETTVAEIQKINGMKDDRIRPGDRLKLP